jgi:acyl carrier protein
MAAQLPIPAQHDIDAALATVVGILRTLTADYGIDIPLDPTLEFQASLELDSVDLAQLAAELWSHYDSRVNLAEYCSQLDFDTIATLSLGDIARYVASVTQPDPR